jgi:hypothetical protein
MYWINELKTDGVTYRTGYASDESTHVELVMEFDDGEDANYVHVILAGVLGSTSHGMSAALATVGVNSAFRALSPKNLADSFDPAGACAILVDTVLGALVYWVQAFCGASFRGWHWDYAALGGGGWYQRYDFVQVGDSQSLGVYCFGVTLEIPTIFYPGDPSYTVGPPVAGIGVSSVGSGTSTGTDLSSIIAAIDALTVQAQACASGLQDLARQDLDLSIDNGRAIYSIRSKELTNP